MQKKGQMKYVIIFCFLGIGFFGFSQIVNMENERLTGNQQGFRGTAEVNFSFTMNTRQLLQIGEIVRLGYVKEKHQFLAVGDHLFIKSEGADFVNRGFQHLRYTYTLKDSGRISLEAFQQGQFNRIQRINKRLLLGGGVRANLIDKKNYQLILGSGFMGEYEELVNLNPTRDILSTSYLSFDGQFNESFGVNMIWYFQPKMIDFGNYRFSNETSIRLKINKHLTFRMIYSVTHESRDLPEVRKTNYFVRNSLQIKF